MIESDHQNFLPIDLIRLIGLIELIGFIELIESIDWKFFLMIRFDNRFNRLNRFFGNRLRALVGMSMAKACMVFIPGLARPVSACIWCSGVHSGVQHNLVWPCSELLVLTGVRSGIENAAQCPLWCRHGAN